MGAPEPAGQDLAVGTTIGKYEILRKLATGGMAELYLVRARSTAGFEKLVVLKRILPSVATDPMFVQMFLDEARLAASLQHPNIADVYDVGEHDGTYFFTMEFVHGQDARAVRAAARKRGEPVPLAIALAFVHGIATALDYAHARTDATGKPLGLVHRDVSTTNVMVSYDGAIKLLDFGIARASSSTHKTQVGSLKGKISYMSPEQCKGMPLDRRSDLFSLGIVLYELCVGRRPFRGDSDFAIMDQIVYRGAQRPVELLTGFPEDLDAIVMKLLAREPDARYDGAEELNHDLEQVMTQLGLWQSPKSVSRYMRSLFGDRIAAWEQAAQHGVSFTEHIATAITSKSQESDLATPPSLAPLRSRTAELDTPRPRPASQPAAAAVARATAEAAAALATSAANPATVVAATPDVASPAIPQLRPRRLPLVIGGAVVAIGAACAITYLVMSAPAPPAGSVEPVVSVPAPAVPAPAVPAQPPPAAVAVEPVTTPVTRPAAAAVTPPVAKLSLPRVPAPHAPPVARASAVHTAPVHPPTIHAEVAPPTPPQPPKPEPAKPETEATWDRDAPLLPQ